MEKRVTFNERWLPYLLVAPQIAITLVFFFWPSGQAIWQSVLLVGTGGIISLPLGWALSIWLDAILKSMPDIPGALHFFVFEPRALVWHGSLLAVTAALAAVYPMWLVARLPIAATLRNEVVS